MAGASVSLRSLIYRFLLLVFLLEANKMNRSFWALTALLLPFAVLTAPVPEPFVAGWGNPLNPDRDCKIRRDKSVLTIEIPGSDHDYEPRRKRFNAPRLIREFEGDFEIQMRVRIDSLSSPQSSVKGQPSYVSAGFLVISPEPFAVDCLRSEYRVAGQGDGVDGSAAHFLWFVERGGGDGIWDKTHPNWPFTGKPDYVYLRLERWGDYLGITISPDRKKWMNFGGGRMLGLPPKLKVGFLACSTSTDPSKVQFDQLAISRSKKREPWEFVSGWGNPVDPDKDCRIRRDKDSLTIGIPGRDHDYDAVRKRFNAPRLLCDLEGDFDLEVRVRIEYRPSPRSTVKGQPSFVSAGFLFLYPETERTICDRLEFAVSQHGSRPDGYAVAPRFPQPRRNGPGQQELDADGYAVWKRWYCDLKEVSRAERLRQRKENRYEWDRSRLNTAFNIWERGWQNWPQTMKTDCAYLRLEKREDWAYFYIRPDGEKWTRVQFLDIVPAGGKLGLAAYSTSTEPSRVRFDQIKLARTKQMER